MAEGQLDYFSGGRPPVIIQHPTSQTVGIGDNTFFAVQASGTGTLSYQWLRNWVNLTDGSPYSGTLTGTLTVTGVSAAEAGGYRCVVSNENGPATSNQATLKVLSPNFDGDDDVDLTDFAHLQLCLGVPQFISLPGCTNADLDGNQTVNVSDVQKFKKCRSGQAVPLTPGCLSLP